jgi:hypothetical protein
MLIKYNSELSFIKFKKDKTKALVMYIFSSPDWFAGYDIFLELLFAVITLLISAYAFKVYRLAGQKQSRLFGISFLLISVSYIIESFLNFAILSNLNSQVCSTLNVGNLVLINNIGIFVHMAFYISGLLVLAYMTLKIKSPKTFTLISLITLIIFVLEPQKMFMFYVISSVLLIYIVMHYLLNFVHDMQPKKLIVLTAFSFLLFGSIHYLFSVNHQLFYVISHFLELIAYLLLLINLILVVKK